MAYGFSRRALEAEPENPLAHFYAGWALYQQGLKAEAAARFEMAVQDEQLRKEHPEALYNLAFCELAQEPPRYESAKAHLQGYLELRPRDATAMYHLGAGKYYLGEFDGAIDLWQKASLVAASEAHDARERARTLAREGKLAESAEAYQQAISLFTADRGTYVELAQLLWPSGRLDAVINALEAMLESFPDDPQAYFQIAKAYEWKGDLESAARSYEKAAGLVTDPAMRSQIDSAMKALHARAVSVGESQTPADRKEDAGGGGDLAEPALEESAEVADLLRKARLELQQGNIDAAASFARKVLEVDPSSASARYYIGRQLFAQGKIAEAALVFEKASAVGRAVEKTPNIAYYLALCYVDPALRRYEDAVSLLGGYIGKTGANPAAYYHLGGAEYLLGDRDGALKQWHKGFSASAQHSAFLLARAQEAMKMRDRATAEIFVQMSFAAFPYNVDALLELARLRHARGEGVAAVETLERGLELFSGDKRIHYLAAQIYEAEGDPGMAVFNYKRYLSLEDDIDVRREIDRKLRQLRAALPARPLNIRPLWEGLARPPAQSPGAVPGWQQ